MQQPPNQDYPQQQWQQPHTSWGSTPQWQPLQPLQPQYPQQIPPPQQQWQQTPIPPPQQWNLQPPPFPQQQYQQAPQYQPPLPPKKKSRKRFWLILAAVVLVLIVIIGVASQGQSQPSASTNQSTQTTQQPTLQPTPNPTAQPTQAVRQVQGKTTTLGAGTFSGGKDVPVGLYDVTAPGQSGNFMVSGTDTYNEIFGQGVTKIRVQISDGDQIQLSGLSNVTFTPVSTPFVTTHTRVILYAGTFIVGQDIGAGRYVATTTPGSSGNFMVSGQNSVNDILGQNDFGGVPSVTTDLTDGDEITISGLGQVTMTPA